MKSLCGLGQKPFKNLHIFKNSGPKPDHLGGPAGVRFRTENL